MTRPPASPQPPDPTPGQAEPAGSAPDQSEPTGSAPDQSEPEPERSAPDQLKHPGAAPQSAQPALDPAERAGDAPDGPAAAPDRRLLARLPTDPGLCARCLHLRLLASPRSVFVRCALAASDPRFPRYPALPVLACPGFQPDAARD